MFLLLALVRLSGCSTNEIIVPPTAPAIAELGKKPALPWRVLLAPVEDARGAAPDGGGALSAPVPQFEELEEELVQVLSAANACAEVRRGRKLATTVERRLAADRDAARAYEARLVEEAFEAGLDLVLRLRVLRYDVTFDGTSEHPLLYLFSIYNFLTAYFPCWWIADEDFSCSLEVEATLTAVGPERLLIDRKVYAGRARRTLDDFERGLTLMGPLFLRWSLDDPEHWRRVADVTGPPARLEVERALMADLKGLTDPSLTDASHAVIVGAGRAPKARRFVISAEEDAGRIRDLLVSGRVLPEKNARSLIGVQATRAATLEALEKTAALARPRDRIYFYFAGFGTMTREGPALVTADFDPAAPEETSLPLREVARALGRSPARSIAILDAAFSAVEAKDVRALAGRGPAASDPGRDFAGLAAANHVVILAGGRTGRAYSSEQGGNFTCALIDAAGDREAPAGADGFVTLEGILEKVRSDTRAPYDPPQELERLGAESRFDVPLHRIGGRP